MLTIGQLAKKYALSRSTLIYYDKCGVLSPSGRSHSNYRLYSESDLRKMDRIMLFRSAGLSLETISTLLKKEGGNLESALENRLSSLNDEIRMLRNQQSLILKLLKSASISQGARVLNKELWVSILRSTGLDDEGMKKWHVEFEKASPEAHRDFLESIGIEHDEIELIRAWSRSGEN